MRSSRRLGALAAAAALSVPLLAAPPTFANVGDPHVPIVVNVPPHPAGPPRGQGSSTLEYAIAAAGLVGLAGAGFVTARRRTSSPSRVIA